MPLLCPPDFPQQADSPIAPAGWFPQGRGTSPRCPGSATPASAATARTVRPRLPSLTSTLSAALSSSGATCALGVRGRHPVARSASSMASVLPQVSPVRSACCLGHGNAASLPPASHRPLDRCRMSCRFNNCIGWSARLLLACRGSHGPAHLGTACTAAAIRIMTRRSHISVI
jgi:hypothetical protein